MIGIEDKYSREVKGEVWWLIVEDGREL